MRLLELECQNCGAALKIDKDTNTVSCPYCKATYKIDEEEKKTKNSNMVNSKMLVVFIVFAILLVVIIVMFVGIGLKASFDSTKKVADDISNSENDFINDQAKKENENAKKQQEEQQKRYEEEKKKIEEEEKKKKLEYEVRVFNMSFSNGNKASIFVRSMLDRIITNNKSNKERIITVKYKDVETQDSEKILEISKKLEEFGYYDVLLDYDEDGFVSKITIK